MKIGFSRSFTYVPVWRENDKLPVHEQFHTILLPLELGDLFNAMDVLSRVKSEGNRVELGRDMAEMASPLLAKYVVVNNLSGDDGQPITAEDVVKYPVFMGLMTELIGQLVSYSMPDEAEAKN